MCYQVGSLAKDIHADKVAEVRDDSPVFSTVQKWAAALSQDLDVLELPPPRETVIVLTKWMATS